MLQIGEKGAIPQKDMKTYAIAPHIPCGVITPELLRRIADVAEKYHHNLIKITGAARITIIGLKEEDIDNVWEDLGLAHGAAVGMCVRSVRACPGTTYCKYGQQDALGIGMILDREYHGMDLPGKCKIAVSGCARNCVESMVRDIGLVGTKKGWTILIGGNVGARPRIAQELMTGLDDDGALGAVAGIIDTYKELAKRGERLGKTISRIGLEAFNPRE